MLPKIHGWKPSRHDPKYQVVDVYLSNHRTTKDIFWNHRFNSYVLVEFKSDAFGARCQPLKLDGKDVCLVAVNGAGEVRWTVEQWQLDSALHNEPEPWAATGDGAESLEAARHFGLVPPRVKP